MSQIGPPEMLFLGASPLELSTHHLLQKKRTVHRFRVLYLRGTLLSVSSSSSNSRSKWTHVFAGGCLGVGNTGPVVEFNIQVSCPELLSKGLLLHLFNAFHNTPISD
jgi:hypothetical protein